MSINVAYDMILDPVTGIAPSTSSVQVISRTLPAVANFLDIFCELVNLTPANLILVNIKANNTIIQQYGNVNTNGSGNDVDAINQYNDLPASSEGSPNPILNFTQRTNRAFGGGTQRLVPASVAGGTPTLISGSPKDLEEVTGLNCNSVDANGNQISTLTIEFHIANTGSGSPSINMTANVMDPYPGGPGLLKFVDYKTYNAVSGINVLDKNSAYNIGDGMRLNLEQIFYIPTVDSVTMDNWTHYLQSTPIKQRTQNLNQFVQRSGIIKNPEAITGMYVFDTRELEYGDEVIAIGALNTQFRSLVSVSASGNIAIYQVSQGTLFPSAS